MPVNLIPLTLSKLDEPAERCIAGLSLLALVEFVYPVFNPVTLSVEDDAVQTIDTLVQGLYRYAKLTV